MANEPFMSSGDRWRPYRIPVLLAMAVLGGSCARVWGCDIPGAWSEVVLFVGLAIAVLGSGIPVRRAWPYLGIQFAWVAILGVIWAVAGISPAGGWYVSMAAVGVVSTVTALGGGCAGGPLMQAWGRVAVPCAWVGVGLAWSRGELGFSSMDYRPVMPTGNVAVEAAVVHLTIIAYGVQSVMQGWSRARGDVLWSWFGGIATLWFLVGTGRRALALGIVLGVIILVAHVPWRRWIRTVAVLHLVLVLMAGLAVMLSVRTERKPILAAAWERVEASLPWGTGPASMADPRQAGSGEAMAHLAATGNWVWHGHQELLERLMMAGYLGACGWIALWCWWWWACWRLGPGPYRAAVATLGAGGFIVQMTNPALTTVMGAWWWGVVMALPLLESGPNEQKSPPPHRAVRGFVAVPVAALLVLWAVRELPMAQLVDATPEAARYAVERSRHPEHASFVASRAAQQFQAQGAWADSVAVLESAAQTSGWVGQMRMLFQEAAMQATDPRVSRDAVRASLEENPFSARAVLRWIRLQRQHPGIMDTPAWMGRLVDAHERGTLDGIEDDRSIRADAVRCMAVIHARRNHRPFVQIAVPIEELIARRGDIPLVLNTILVAAVEWPVEMQPILERHHARLWNALREGHLSLLEAPEGRSASGLRFLLGLWFPPVVDAVQQGRTWTPSVDPVIRRAQEILERQLRAPGP